MNAGSQQLTSRASCGGSQLPAAIRRGTRGIQRRVTLWPLGIAAIVLTALGVSAWPRMRGTAEAARVVRFQLQPPTNLAFTKTPSTVAIPQVAVSPDGAQLAFVAAERGKSPSIWLRSLDDTAVRSITGTTTRSIRSGRPTADRSGSSPTAALNASMWPPAA